LKFFKSFKLYIFFIWKVCNVLDSYFGMLGVVLIYITHSIEKNVEYKVSNFRVLY